MLCYTDRVEEPCSAGNLITEIDFMYIDKVELLFLIHHRSETLMKQGEVGCLFFRKLISASENLGSCIFHLVWTKYIVVFNCIVTGHTIQKLQAF